MDSQIPDERRLQERLFSYKCQDGSELFEWSSYDYSPDIWISEVLESDNEAEEPDCISWENGCTQLQFRIGDAESAVRHFIMKDYPPSEKPDQDLPNFYFKVEKYPVSISEIISCGHISVNAIDLKLFQIAVFVGRCLGEGEWLDGIMGCGASWGDCEDFDREQAKELANFVRQEFSRYIDKECTCGRLATKVISEFSASYT